MSRIAILEDDPLVGRHTADVIGELVRFEAVLATSTAAQAPAIEGSAAVIVGAQFGGRPLAASVAAARARDPHRPVLVVCPNGDADAIDAAAALVGALAVVTRPVTAAALLPRLVAALDRAALARSVDELTRQLDARDRALASTMALSLIHISEPTRPY